MTLSAALQGTFKEMRKDNTVGITVQTCSDIFGDAANLLI